MELRSLFVPVLFILLLGCKREKHIDPEESAKSYVSYSIDGKKYRLEHGNESQYVNYFLGNEGGNIFPYKLGIAARDSTGKAPSFLIAIWSEEPVTKGVWKVSTDYNLTSKVLMSWVHLKTKNPLVYRAYWSFYEGTVEVTELTENTIRGVFSGVLDEDPNGVFRTYEKFKVTDGEFFVNRRPGYSVKSKY